jgi:methionine sulfoxide reductase heme-binding subunit
MSRRGAFFLLGAAVAIILVTAMAQIASDPQASTHVYWYISRVTGFTAYLVLFVNMVFGLMLSTKQFDDLVVRWRSYDLHQFTALLAMAFMAVHVFALLGDTYTRFSLAQLLVPLASSYRPVWIALGVISLYALIAVTFTFYVRSRIGQRAWRAIHYVSFLAFALVFVHGVFSGTDTSQLWARVIYWSTGLVVSLLTVARFVDPAGAPATATNPRPQLDRAAKPRSTTVR